MMLSHQMLSHHTPAHTHCSRHTRHVATPRAMHHTEGPTTGPTILPTMQQRVAAALLSATLTLSASVGAWTPPPAEAVLNSPNARIARSADAALRRSVPGFNADVKDVQAKLEVWRMCWWVWRMCWWVGVGAVLWVCDWCWFVVYMYSSGCTL